MDFPMFSYDFPMESQFFHLKPSIVWPQREENEDAVAALKRTIAKLAATWFNGFLRPVDTVFKPYGSSLIGSTTGVWFRRLSRVKYPLR